MGKLNVMNGTPVGGAHLCRGCNWGQVVMGYRESDLLVVCINSNPARVIPFVVCECTEYQDRNRPDFDQMQNLAINFSQNTRRKPTPGFRSGGFGFGPMLVEKDVDEEEADAVARS
jgi:hypothetical protein